MPDLEQLSTWDRESFFHPSTHLGEFARGDAPRRQMVGGTGCFVEDAGGNRMLDAFAGLYCVNVGYGRTEIADAIAKQAHELAYYHAYAGHSTEASVTLAKMVVDRAPAHMGKVYFGLSGSDANETNIKLVWYYNNILGRPKKKKIISRWRGYHGSGLMTGSLTGLHLFHQKFDLPFDQVLHTQAPYYYWREDESQSEAEFSAHCAQQLENLILSEGADTIAAFIGEPVLGTGGLVPPPEGYWQAIQEVLDRYDILLIVDEVVTGFGRLGTMFGSDFFGLKPDLITIAKGLTSAYAPLSGSIVSDRMYDVLMQGTDENGPLGHGWTYSAHPIAAAAGVANLKLIDDLGLLDNVNKVGPYLVKGMAAALQDVPWVGEVRGVGMLCAVELVKDRANRTPLDASTKAAMSTVAAMAERGVIARAMPESQVIGYAPPLCLSTEEADTIISVTRESIEKACAGL